MARDEHGFLKADALRTAGLREQFAVEIGGVRHVVEIVHDRSRGGYVLDYTTHEPDGQHKTSWQTGDDLRLAQQKYRELVAQLRRPTRG